MAKWTHWTERNVEDFTHSLSSDFVIQLEKRIEDEEVTKKKIADRLGITAGAVSQVLNSPGNLELKTMVQYARAVGMKVAVVVYDDSDPDNSKGPVISGIFEKCWERLGKPQDYFDLDDMKQSAGCWVLHRWHVQAEAKTADQRIGAPVKMEHFADTAEGRLSA